jgi:hypothetical protein
MRVQSQKPSEGKAGGWLHMLGGEIPKYAPIKPSKPVTIDAHSLWCNWMKGIDATEVKAFAAKLGVDAMALIFLGCVWAPEHRAWAFPMKDGDEKIVGIRLRDESGQKWAVKGSRQGLFVPNMDFSHQAVITEGPTDCAAALSLGFGAIGRPSCLGCEEILSKVILKRNIREVVIVSDNDGPGMAGASKLQESLKVRSAIFIPPCKDLREFVSSGGTRELFDSLVKNLIWSKS